MLSSLSVVELKQFYQQCQQQDPEAMRLLDAYINKEHPHIREGEDWGSQQSSTSLDQGAMSTEDALDILGLNPGATKKKSPVRIVS